MQAVSENVVAGGREADASLSHARVILAVAILRALVTLDQRSNVPVLYAGGGIVASSKGLAKKAALSRSWSCEDSGWKSNPEELDEPHSEAVVMIFVL
jgi:hypothetical protein